MPTRPTPRVPPAPRRPWLQWAAPLIVAAVALLAYANSLSNGFVWDDPIILSRQLIVFRSLGTVLLPPRDIPQFSPDYYRPLTVASYLLDRAVGGEGPFAFHLSVVLAHAATSVLVYALLLQLLAAGVRLPRAESMHLETARIGACVGGALFALHPIHSESVAWAAGRSDVLATGFLVAALVLTGRTGLSWGGAVLAGICTAAALGAKETAVALYPLMLLRDALVPPTPRPTMQERLRSWVGPLVAGAAYVLLRRAALGEFVGSAPDALAASQRSAGDVVAAVGMYVGRLLLPVRLNAYIDHIDGGPLPVALAALLVTGLGAAVWLWWARPAQTRGVEAARVQAVKGARIQAVDSPRKGPAGADPRTLGPSNPGLPLFALTWLALTLAPSLAILWKIPDAPLAERYLYLPSVGFCLLCGDLLSRCWVRAASPRAHLATVAGVVALLAVAAIGTAQRNRVWHDDIALWENSEPMSQVSGMAARSVGTAYQNAGRAADARAAFERALRRHNSPRGIQTINNNLGTLAMYDGDYTAARRYYEAALAANPTADTMFNLGLAILHSGGRSRQAAQAALPHYQRAQSVSPHDPDIEAALAEVYDILGQQDLAAQHARRALELGAQGQTADSLRAMLRR